MKRVSLIVLFTLICLLLSACNTGSQASSSTAGTSESSGADNLPSSSSHIITPPESSSSVTDETPSTTVEDYDGYIEDYNLVSEENIKYLLTALYPKAVEVEDKLFGNALIGTDFYSRNAPAGSSNSSAEKIPADDKDLDTGEASINDDTYELPEHWVDISHLGKLSELKELYSTTYTKYCIFSNNPFGEGESTRARFKEAQSGGLLIDYFYPPKVNISTIDVTTANILYQEAGKKVIVEVEATNSIEKIPLGPKILEIVYEDGKWKLNNLAY